MKASVLALTALLASSAQALAHSGHIPAAGGAHAFEHAMADLVLVAAAVLVVAAGAMLVTRNRHSARDK